LKIVANSFDKPAMANMIEGGKTPLLTTKELNEMGFKLVAFAVSCLLAAAKAMQRAMKVLKEEGSTQAIVAEMMDFGDFNDLIGFPDVRSFEAKYRN
jgi:2,3-dimethylmalate lyase